MYRTLIIRIKLSFYSSKHISFLEQKQITIYLQFWIWLPNSSLFIAFLIRMPIDQIAIEFLMFRNHLYTANAPSFALQYNLKKFMLFSEN